MALEKLNPSELILMDKTYRDRLALRKSLLGEQHDIVVAVNNDSDPRVREAVWELYTFLLGTYLPGRYPTMFKLHHQTRRLENLVTGEMWPVVPADTDPTILPLETLVKIVDEDFLFLLPEEQNQKDDKKKEPKYILEAYSTCFPSGFNPRKKLGLLLANIHGPVPHYREKLERSMDKFFAKVEVGKYVRRVNWTVTTNAELFAAFGGTHAAVDEELEKIQPGELDVDQTILRCERQTLHRLPKSKALVFAFHTYVYPIQSIKDEGLGEELARAIDGLKEGSAPRMHIYKRGAVWGEAVKAFLRS
ncbi:hypothetical protein MAP00_002347 [Monascus purpureus]|nr:hypothetical protein MAP00_002347 [Monascus purpureus]